MELMPEAPAAVTPSSSLERTADANTNGMSLPACPLPCEVGGIWSVLQLCSPMLCRRCVFNWRVFWWMLVWYHALRTTLGMGVGAAGAWSRVHGWTTPQLPGTDTPNRPVW